MELDSNLKIFKFLSLNILQNVVLKSSSLFSIVLLSNLQLLNSSFLKLYNFEIDSKNEIILFDLNCKRYKVNVSNSFNADKSISAIFSYLSPL